MRSNSGHLTIRPEQPGDEKAIAAVTAAAFGRVAEAELVDQLRAEGQLRISLVAWLDDVAVGHVAFSPVHIKYPVPFSALGLGPLSIVPEQQRRGIGGQLTRLGLAYCLAQDEPLVFLLGHPEYYPRFGFRPAPILGFTCKWARRGNHFMVAALRDGALAGRRGQVHFHSAFG